MRSSHIGYTLPTRSALLSLTHNSPNSGVKAKRRRREEGDLLILHTPSV